MEDKWTDLEMFGRVLTAYEDWEVEEKGILRCL